MIYMYVFVVLVVFYVATLQFSCLRLWDTGNDTIYLYEIHLTTKHAWYVDVMVSHLIALASVYTMPT